MTKEKNTISISQHRRSPLPLFNVPITGLIVMFFPLPVANAQQWLIDANQRIEQHRKGDLNISIVDSLGQPIEGAQVQVNMQRHSFKFGTAVTASWINDGSSNGDIYRDKLLENFNTVVFENDMKWPPWEGLWGSSFNWPNTDQALDWLDANGLPARGHYLSWAAWSGSDAWGTSSDVATLPNRLFDHITEKTATVGDRVTEWDVINHPVGWLNDSYENRIGLDFYQDIIDHARAVAPVGMPMWINEDDITSGGNTYNYERIIQHLIDVGSPPDGIGIQGHINQNWGRIRTPEQVYTQLDQMANLIPRLKITEFDVNTPGNDAYQAQLLHDYLVTFFSHPAMEEVLFWGFWSNAHWLGEDAALYRPDWTEKPALYVYQDLVFNQWWSDADGMTNLSGTFDVRGFLGEYEIEINYQGQQRIVPYSLEPGSNALQVVFSVPEPSAVVMALLSIAFIVGTARRRLRMESNGRSVYGLCFSSKAFLVGAETTITAFAIILNYPGSIRADIFEWEFSGIGKQESSTLVPDGAGVDAVPGADLSSLDLTMAYLIRADLTDANFQQTNLTNADLSSATLTIADFTNAEIFRANFRFTTGSGFTAAQLYSTANYQAQDLIGVGLADNDLSGWTFAGQNLTDADFSGAALANADLTNAEVRGADFWYATNEGFTSAQLYSTASYQAQDLTGIILDRNDLSAWVFSGQNLTDADFLAATLTDTDLSQAELVRADFGSATLSNTNLSQSNLSEARFLNASLIGADFSYSDLSNAYFSEEGFAATLSNADLTGAEVRGAHFGSTTSKGFTAVQLYSTASYQAKDLTGTVFRKNHLAGWDFSGQNLTDTDFYGSTLTGTNFQGANLTNTDFAWSNLNEADFRQANLTGVRLHGVDLFDADLTDAVLRGANLSATTDNGFTAAQLYSTASYQDQDLSEFVSWYNDMSGWDFSGQNLTGSNFRFTTLDNADFSGANLTNATFEAQLATMIGANLSQTNLTGADFEDRDLTSADLSQANLTSATFRGGDLSAANLSGANLRDADISYANLSNAILTGAEVRGTAFDNSPDRGITTAQLYATVSYQAKDLSGISLYGNDMSDGNFAGQNLTEAIFRSAILTNANLSLADLTGASFSDATLINAILADAKIVGADFTSTTDNGFTAAQLYSTASYLALDLSGIELGSNNLTGWNFTGQNLTDADLAGATLTDVDLNGADIRGVNFNATTSSGFTASQLYSTASYQMLDLSGIDLSSNDLSGWDFSHQNLAKAAFLGGSWTGPVVLENTNFTGADLRGASVADDDLDEAITTNAILPNGVVAGLNLLIGQKLLVRDYDGNPDASSGQTDPLSIVVEQEFETAAGSVFQMIFEGDAWDSLISFEPGIPVALGGALRLDFAGGVDIGSQVGRTIDLFEWTGVAPTGTFAVASPYIWDVSKLYTTGEVTLLSVPETKSAALMIWITFALFCTRSWWNSPHHRFVRLPR